jgi:hypothetical protein
MNPLTRGEFLQRTTMAGLAVLLSSIEGFALTRPEEKIRVGLIGCGSVSGQYLPHLACLHYAEVVSLCDIVFVRAQKRGAEYNIANHYPHIDQMLAGVPFDLLVNTTDMQEHGRLIQNMRCATEINHVCRFERPLPLYTCIHSG